MEHYCSSPNCRNKCGKKENIGRDRMWRDPASVEGVLCCYEEFCDNDGELIKKDEHDS